MALLVAALLGALTVGVDPALAIPPRCPDGSPPPCDSGDPPETTPTTRRTTTTIAIPTTTVATTPPTTALPPTNRKVSVLLLVQDDGGLTGAVNAERYWKYEPVNAPPGTLLGPGPGDTVLGMTPAGTSGLVNNEFTFPDYPLPAGQEMVMRVSEAGSPGALCRTVPRSALPPSGAPLHILVAPPLTLGADELSDMASSFVGPIAAADLPSNVTMEITSATLAPQSDSLGLNLQGTMTVDLGAFGTYDYTFDYDLPLRLVPSTSTKLASVLSVQAAGAGTVELTSTSEPNGDGIIPLIQAELLPKLRAAVPVKGTPAVNDRVHSDHDVQWWADQDFHISMRRVAYATTGLTLYPSLCRLG
jgi:hypothetical protein